MKSNSSNELQNLAFYSLDKTQSDSLELNFHCDRESLIQSFGGFHSSVLATAAKAKDILPLWRCAYREPLSHMYRGRLMLAGDAAHAMLPHQGQGAAQSIEDAAALGILLQSIPDGASDPKLESVEARLKMFENVRRDRATGIQILSMAPPRDADFGCVAEMWQKYLPGHKFPSKYHFQSSRLLGD